MGIRLLFFGTAEFGVPVLRALVSDHRFEVRAVYSQPDRPAGRGRRLRPAPVARAAQDLGLPLEQPVRLRGEVIGRIRSYEPDAVVLAAYGLIVPRAALEVPWLGWINVHPSLLPRHRGATPVVRTILEGDRETGVSFFLMGPGLDDGPVLAQVRTPVGEAETAGELTARLAELAAREAPEVVARWAAGGLSPRSQDDSLATYALKLTKDEGMLDWSLSAEELARRVRALNPWPMAFTLWRGQRLRVLRAEPLPSAPALEPGRVFVPEGSKLPAVACAEGALLLREVQLPGSRAMDGAAFLAGHRELVGSGLGGQEAPRAEQG